MSNRSHRFLRSSAAAMLAFISVSFASPAFAQSTGTIQGSVTDPANAPIPGAPGNIHEENTGLERMVTTDSAGFYSVPSLPVGVYRVEVRAKGMAPTAAPHLVLSVGTTVAQDFSLKVA